MLIKGSMVTEMSGSLGGITAARNKGGLYLRARSVPVNPNSPAQIAARTSFTELVTAWTEQLSATEREAFETYASNVPVTNSLGDAKFLSGQNWFVRLNAPRLEAGAARLDAAPTIFDQATLNAVSISYDGVGGFDITFDDMQAWTADDDARLIVQQSKPQNATKTFFKGPFRFNDSIAGDSVTPITSPTNLTSLFPVFSGQKVYMRIRLSLSDGRLSSPQIVSTTLP